MNLALSLSVEGILTTLGIMFVMLIYFENRMTLSAVAKLNHNKIEELIAKLSSFRKALEVENNYSKNTFTKYNKLVSLGRPSLDDQQRKREHRKSLICKGLQRKYLMYVLRVLIIGASGVAPNLYFSTIPNIWIESLQTKVNQLYFCNWMKLRITVAYMESFELISLNGSLIAENRTFAEQYVQTLEDFESIKNSVFGLLLENKKDIDPELQSVLINDGCSDLGEYFSSYCAQIRADISNPSFVQLVYKMEEIIKSRYESFLVSNRSLESLNSIDQGTSTELFNLNQVISEQNRIISSIFNDRFDDSLAEIKHQSNINICSFFGIVVVVFPLIWILYFKPLLESWNELKKVSAGFSSRSDPFKLYP